MLEVSHQLCWFLVVLCFTFFFYESLLGAGEDCERACDLLRFELATRATFHNEADNPRICRSFA